MTEEWKDIEGYEGYYQVSNLGRVRSVDREITYKDGRVRDYPGTLLKRHQTKAGYLLVNLSKNGVDTSNNIHRLVAEAFVCNRDNKKCVNHINGDKKDNCVTNLEWCTYAENTQHAFATGLQIGSATGRFGSKHNRAKEGYAVSPWGQLFYFHGITEFCRIQGLSPSNFNAMLLGNQETSKGWTRV